MSNGSLQQQIDQAGAGGVLRLAPARKEFQGPAVIRHALTIEGQSCTVWSEQGPVLVIDSPGVTINDLNVEVTVDTADDRAESCCALKVCQHHDVTLNHVAIRGCVIGLDEEEGEWRYPSILRLGALQSGHAHNFTAKLVVPVPCQFRSEIAGLAVNPAKTRGGAVKLQLKLDPLSPGTILRGTISIRTASLTRYIHVNANAPRHATGREAVGNGQDVYEPDDWQTLFADEDVSSPAPRKPPAKAPDTEKPASLPPKSLPPTGTKRESTRAGKSQPPQIPVRPPTKKPAAPTTQNRDQSGPEVTVPDRLDSEPVGPKPRRSVPAPFDPSVLAREAPPTKPPQPTEPTPETSEARPGSSRRRVGMGTSIFVSPPATNEASSGTSSGTSEDTSVKLPDGDPRTPPESDASVVPPPPPSLIPPAPNKRDPVEEKLPRILPEPPSLNKSPERRSQRSGAASNLFGSDQNAAPTNTSPPADASPEAAASENAPPRADVDDRANADSASPPDQSTPTRSREKKSGLGGAFGG